MTVTEREFTQCRAMVGATETRQGSYFCRPSSGDRMQDIVLRRMVARSNGPAAGETRDLIADYQPEYILVVGTCGGIIEKDGSGREGTALGDVVVPDYVHYNELKKLTPGRNALRYAPFDQPSHRLHSSHIDGLRFGATWVVLLDERVFHRDSFAKNAPADSTGRCNTSQV